MLYRFKYIIYILFVLISQNILASKYSLHELYTKQSISNIRLFSSSGNLTYYQKRDGSLFVKHLFKIKRIKRSQKNSQYLMTFDDSEKYVTIEEIHNYYSNNNLRKDNLLYVSKAASIKLNKIGFGSMPRLYLSHKYVSFYNFKHNAIYIKRTNNLKNIKTIFLRKKLNPYFIPQTIMLTSNDLIYTDTLYDGVECIILINIAQKKKIILFKAQNIQQRIELLKEKNKLFIAIFSNNNYKHSSIYYIPIKDKTCSQNINLKCYNYVQEAGKNIFNFLLYKNNSDDIGHIIFSSKTNNLFFIKKYLTQDGQYFDDVFNINIASKKLTKKSNFKFLRQIFKMGNLLLAAFNGKIYIIEGENILKQKEFKK